VDDDLVARLAAFFPDHNSRIAGLTLLDDRGAALVARALAHRYAGTNRADAYADTSFFSGRNARGKGKPRRGNENNCAFHRSVPQVLPGEITASREVGSCYFLMNQLEQIAVASIAFHLKMKPVLTVAP
jgi:hypothetical protein